MADCIERAPNCSPSSRAFADRLINCGFVVAVEDQRVVHSCQRYAVVLGGCLRAIVQCQVCYQIGFVMGPGDCRIQRIIPA